MGRKERKVRKKEVRKQGRKERTEGDDGDGRAEEVGMKKGRNAREKQ